MQNVLSSEKGTLDHWATVEFFFSLAQVRCFWRCFDELWTATPFSNDPLWLTLFVEGVNDRLRDHCRVSSVPHYCDFKEQEIPTIYTVWMVINWNSNVNILIFWDTNFWLSLAVSSNNLNIKKKTVEVFYFTCNEYRIYESFTFWNKLQEKINFFTIFKFFEKYLYIL